MKLSDVEIKKIRQRTAKLKEIMPGLSDEAVKESLEFLLEDTELLLEEMVSLKKDSKKAVELSEKEKRLLEELREQSALVFGAQIKLKELDKLQKQKGILIREITQLREQTKAADFRLQQTKYFVEQLLPTMEYIQAMEVFPPYLWAGMVEKVKEQANKLGCDIAKRSGNSTCHHTDMEGGRQTEGGFLCQRGGKAVKSTLITSENNKNGVIRIIKIHRHIT